MRRLMRVVRRNFGYKFLSLAISVLLYLIASAQISPHTSTDVYVIPEVVGVPDDMVVRTGPLGGTVTVSGPSAAVAAFKAQPIKAIVDASRARVGAHQLPIQYKTPGNVDLMGQPRTADVTLEPKKRSELFVDVLSDTLTPPPGFLYLDPVAEPRKVTVSGLAADVAHVARVVAVPPSSASGGAVYQFVDVIAQNERQQTVDSVQIDPPRVQVKVGLRPAPASKMVVLSGHLVGSPLPGYTVTNYEFTPRMVTVSGVQDQLTKRSSLIVPLSVDGLSATTDRTVHLTLPSGLALQNPDDANVRVHILVKPIATLPVPRPTPPITVPAAAPPTPVPAASAAGANSTGSPAPTPTASPTAP